MRILLNKINTLTTEIPEKISKAYIFINKSIWIVFLFSIPLSIVLSFVHYAFNLFCEVRELTGDKRYVCGLIHYTWFPFETEDASWRKFFVAVGVTSAQALLIPFYTATFIGLFGIPYVIRLRIQDLKERIEEASRLKDGFTNEKLNFFVSYYIKIYK